MLSSVFQVTTLSSFIYFSPNIPSTGSHSILFLIQFDSKHFIVPL